MYARSTTVVGDPSSLDRAVTLLRDDLMPELTSMEGCIGLSCLVERQSGRCIATSAWESLEAMQASEGQVAPLRSQLLSTLGGAQPLVQVWEIPVMHRAHAAPEGACARVSWFEGAAANIDNATESFKMVLPALGDLPGFCSASFLINRSTGEAVSTAIYESADAAARTRDMAQGLRTRAAEQGAGEVREVAEFDLALAHLRVPELV
jgi:heme-degrading monooxygenase HmoA